MRRELPPQPHIDHLKKQAKDLLDGHGRGDAEALARIRAALPSFSHLPADEAARAPFALHDAQSAIAREYGFRSWKELRTEVSKRSLAAFPESLIRSLSPIPLPDAVTSALGQAWAERGEAVDAMESALPAALPLVPFRNAVLVPGALAPIHVARASSMAAVEAALASDPPTIAVFSQRALETENVGFDDLHATGCQGLVRDRVPAGDGFAFVILQGLRWVALEAIDPPSGSRPFAVARIVPVAAARGDTSEAVLQALFETLRDRARTLARAMPQAARVLALIDAIDVPERFADMIVANLRVPVADKVRYAAAPSLEKRLRVAVELCEGVQSGSPGHAQ